MSQLNEIIVYIWLLPVTLQIVLPLAVLAVWSIASIPKMLLSKPATKHENTRVATA